MTPKSWSALGVVYVIWGSTYLAIAIAVETLPPLLAVSTRFILAGAIMALVVRARRGSLRISRPLSLLRCSSAACCPVRTPCSSSPSATCRSGSRR